MYWRIGRQYKLNRLNPLPAIVQHIPSTAIMKVNNSTLFPKLTYDEIKLISQGSYQIRQSPSYYQNYINRNNNTFFSNVCNETVCKKVFKNVINPLLVSIYSPSRFQSNKKHKVYVLFSEQNKKFKISEYCCSCRHGLRTVGCCTFDMVYVIHWPEWSGKIISICIEV